MHAPSLTLSAIIGAMAGKTESLKPCLLLKTEAVIWKKKQAITYFSLDTQRKGKEASQRQETEGDLSETRDRGRPCGTGLRQETGATMPKLVRNSAARDRQQSRMH